MPALPESFGACHSSDRLPMTSRDLLARYQFDMDGEQREGCWRQAGNSHRLAERLWSHPIESLDHFMRQTWDSRIFQIGGNGSTAGFGQTVRHILLGEQVAFVFEIGDNGRDLL